MTNHYQNGVARAQQEIANKMCGRVENKFEADERVLRKIFTTKDSAERAAQAFEMQMGHEVRVVGAPGNYRLEMK